MSDKEKDQLSGVETTGHDWDGIKELNKPAPRWWLTVWICCIVWAFGYWFFYPAWPTSSGNTKGSLGWTDKKELAVEQKKVAGLQTENLARLHKASLQEIKADPTLYEFAKAGGAAAFKQNCIVCHGSDAAGRKGFPNLNDDDWIWGGKLDDIYKTIKVGVRSTHPDTRNTQMPAFGKDGILTREQVEDTAEYVTNLNKGDKADKNPSYLRGKEIFANNCTVCHGASGEGNHDVGAPRLNDKIWLYADSNATDADIKASVIETITNARAGVMPTWENRLSDDTIKELSIYVHSLGGGE